MALTRWVRIDPHIIAVQTTPNHHPNHLYVVLHCTMWQYCKLINYESDVPIELAGGSNVALKNILDNACVCKQYNVLDFMRAKHPPDHLELSNVKPIGCNNHHILNSDGLSGQEGARHAEGAGLVRIGTE